jgi:hypothetical protein
MKFKDFYEIPKFKKLDKVGKIIYVFSFLIPGLIVYTFLHLYFLPFGLNQNYTLENSELQFTNTDFFYTIDSKEVLDGATEVKIEPRVPKRNVIATVSVKGENAYIVPHRITQKDISFNPEYTKELNEEEYTYLTDYNVKDEDIIVFKIDYEIDVERQKCSEILLKYENLRIIQNLDNIELRLDEKIEGDLKTFQSFFNLGLEEKEQPITLYAIYKKPNQTNGFIEIFANNKLNGRTIVPSQNKVTDDKIADIELETVWNEELTKDFSQKFISLKQEVYTQNLLKNIPEDLRDVVDLNLYYEKLFKPENDIEEEQEEEKEEGDCNEPIETQRSLFVYDEENPNKRYQVFYKKNFFKNFSGNIHSLSVGYGYPIEQKKELKTLFPNTPIYIKIVGEDSEIESINVNLFREPVWEKF